MELRQLRLFVTLAEELHFGRAAAREHIVPSALSQQVQRLERELGVALFDRTTHRVRLTSSGQVLLVQARAVFGAVERAVAAAQLATPAHVLRVGIGDPSFDSMPQVLRNVQYNYPGLVVHRIEAGVPTQYRMLADGGLDVGVGRAMRAPRGIASEVFRLDRVGVLLPADHRLAGAHCVPVHSLARELLLLADQTRAPEYDDFVLEVCRTAGVVPRRYHGSVQSVRAAGDLVAQNGCVMLVPQSCDLLMPHVRWLPLTDPAVHYPWSLLWRAGQASHPVQAVLDSARALSTKLGWLVSPAGAT